MAACIGQIRMQRLVALNDDGTWAEDRQNPLYYLVHVAKVALPLYPQLGTQPTATTFRTTVEEPVHRPVVRGAGPAADTRRRGSR